MDTTGKKCCVRCGGPLRIGRKYCSKECYHKSTSRVILTVEQRFWKYVQKSDGCWAWTGTADGSGRGRLNINVSYKRCVPDLAARISWKISKGPIPDKLFVLHRCDNPNCVNPDHLFLGTQLDNIKDMVAKGRVATGERRNSAKLTDEEVCRIRSLYPSLSEPALARMFGVDNSTLHAIVSGKTWKHLL